MCTVTCEGVAALRRGLCKPRGGSMEIEALEKRGGEGRRQVIDAAKEERVSDAWWETLRKGP